MYSRLFASSHSIEFQGQNAPSEVLVNIGQNGITKSLVEDIDCVPLRRSLGPTKLRRVRGSAAREAQALNPRLCVIEMRSGPLWVRFWLRQLGLRCGCEAIRFFLNQKRGGARGLAHQGLLSEGLEASCSIVAVWLHECGIRQRRCTEIMRHGVTERGLPQCDEGGETNRVNRSLV